MRNKYVWIPLYIFIISFTLFNIKSKGIFLVLFLLLSVGLADYTSSSVVKKTIKRPRPCRQVELQEEIVLMVHCGSGYSFTSSHATNHFALAVFIFLTLGKLGWYFRWPFILWATIIAYSQVYVGVHFPLDIISGAILGTLIGFILAILFNRYVGFQPVKD